MVPRCDLEPRAVREAVAQFEKVPGDAFLSVNVPTETLMSSMLVEASCGSSPTSNQPPRVRAQGALRNVRVACVAGLAS